MAQAKKSRPSGSNSGDESHLKVRLSLQGYKNDRDNSSSRKQSVIKLKLQQDGSEGRKRRLTESKVYDSRKRSRASDSAVEDDDDEGISEAVLRTLLTTALLQTHRQIQVKDVYGIFAEPVDLDKAPGYADIIAQPMDLGTMFVKVEAEQYSNMGAYQTDFELMCNNAMTYNAEHTIYHKAARKLKGQGLKIIAKEAQRLDKSISAVRVTEVGDNVAEDDVDVIGPGIMERGTEEEATEAETGEEDRRGSQSDSAIKSKKLNKPHGHPSSMTNSPESNTLTTLATAKAQASEAAEAIRQKKQLGTRMAFDARGNLVWGPASLARLCYVAPDVTSSQSLPPKVDVDIVEPAESATNKMVPVKSLLYGPYASALPAIDSALATHSANQTELISNCFGDLKGYLYTKTLMKMTRAAGPMALQRTEDRLNKLVEGGFNSAHWPDVDIWSDMAKLGASDLEPVTKEELNCLESLKDIGVTVPDLTRVVTSPEPRLITTNQELLDDTAGLLWELEKTQLRRIRHGRINDAYTSKQIALAQEIVFRLTALMEKTTPASVANETTRDLVTQAVSRTATKPSSTTASPRLAHGPPNVIAASKASATTS